jgi:hypothetical protein
VSMPRFHHGRLPQCTWIADVFGHPPWVASVWLRGDPVRLPSKNFLANPQLDI